MSGTPLIRIHPLYIHPSRPIPPPRSMRLFICSNLTDSNCLSTRRLYERKDPSPTTLTHPKKRSKPNTHNTQHTLLTPHSSLILLYTAHTYIQHTPQHHDQPHTTLRHTQPTPHSSCPHHSHHHHPTQHPNNTHLQPTSILQSQSQPHRSSQTEHH